MESYLPGNQLSRWPQDQHNSANRPRILSHSAFLVCREIPEFAGTIPPILGQGNPDLGGVWPSKAVADSRALADLYEWPFSGG